MRMIKPQPRLYKNNRYDEFSRIYASPALYPEYPDPLRGGFLNRGHKVAARARRSSLEGTPCASFGAPSSRAGPKGYWTT